MQRSIRALLFLLWGLLAFAQAQPQNPALSAPLLTVITPNGGEQLSPCQLFDITWTEANAPAGNYRLAYSLNGGASWVSIDSNYATTASTYSWVVPNVPTTNVLVLVQSALDTTIADTSDAVFEILSPVLAARSDTAICIGQTIQLMAMNGFNGNYSWKPAATLSDSTIANPTDVPSATTTYTVTSVQNGCSVSDSVVITVNPLTTDTVNVSITTTPPFCAGSAVMFTATPITSGNPPSYQWQVNGVNDGTNSDTFTASSLMNGDTVAVVMTSGAVCPTAATTTDTAIVSIVPIPATPSAVAANSPVCVGDSITLTTNAISGATYAWTGPNGFTSNLQNPVLHAVTQADTGTYTLSISVNGCPSASAQAAVQVNLPAQTPVATASGSFCEGADVDLLASTVNGATYTWTGPNGFASTQQNLTIVGATALASGAYSVTATLNGCVSPADTVLLSILPTQAAPIPTTTAICAGDTLQLFASSIAGATSYIWSGVNGFSANTQNPEIIGADTLDSGFYNVYAIANGCSTLTESVRAVVNPSPAAPTVTNISPVCENTQVSLSASFVNGATYSWTGANGFTSNLQNPIVTASAANLGVYSVSVTVNGCSSPVATTSISATAVPATPTAAATGQVCEGDTIALTLGAVSGATYNWTGVNGFASTQQSPILLNATAANTGKYAVTITLNGCTSEADTVSVQVNAIPAAPVAGINGAVCEGDTLFLTASGITNANYFWTGANGFISSQQNPSLVGISAADAGTYSVFVSVNGCSSASSSAIVAVNAIPATPTAANSGTACAGSNISLTASTVANASYAWNGPNGYTSTLQNPVLSNVTASGNYTVTANINGCASLPASTSVTVSAAPAMPVASVNVPLCAGNSLKLTATLPTTGATFAWTGPNGFTSTQQNPTIANATVAAAGLYSVTATANGCTSQPDTITVAVNAGVAAPTTGSNSPVCLNTPLNLTASAIAGATYAWTGPGSFASTQQNPTIASMTAAAAGTYTVVATLGGCSSAPATVVVSSKTVPNAPTANNGGTACAGVNINLTASNITGATYSWTGPNGYTASVQNPILASTTTSMTGTYSVTATVNGCTSLPGNTVVTVKTRPAAPTVTSNSPVCTGNALTLTSTSTAGATYAWTGPASYTSTQQNPTITAPIVGNTGTYSVIATLNGCASPAGTAAVTVRATPATPSPNNSGPICVGTALSLTTATVTNATYAWSGPNSYTSTQQNPTIANAAATASGVYNVTVTVNSCTSLAGSTTAVVNTTPPSPAATNGGTVCAGDTVRLFATGTAAIYNWTGPNGFVATVKNPKIPNGAGGTYSVTAANGTCTSAASPTTITVNAAPATPAPTISTPSCVGATLTLSANTTTGTFQWKGPNNYTSTVANPVLTNATAAMSGSYTLRVVGANGCASQVGSVSVTVTPTPAVAQASSNSPLCAGSVLNLTATPVSGASYSWTGPGGFTSTLQTPTIQNSTLAATGVYSVVTNVNGCESLPDTVSVVVSDIPTKPVISANSPICSGDTLKLVATSTPNAIYSWSGPNAFTSSQQNPVIVKSKTANTGIYTVTAAFGTCVSASSTVTVTVTVSPTVNLPDSLRGCGSVTLNASVSNATYVWSSGETTASISPTQSGKYIVSVKNASGCVTKDSTKVTVNIKPVASFVGVQLPNLEYSFTNTTTGVSTYTWDFGDVASGAANISTLPSPTHVYTTPGIYIISLKAKNECGNSTAIDTIEVMEGVSIAAETLAGRIRLYPNPSEGTFFVEMSDLAAENMQVTLLQADGKTLWVRNLSASEMQTAIRFDESLSQGVYLLRFATENAVMTKKLVIQ